MDIKPIRTDADHAAALRAIEALWGAAEGSAEGDRLDILATLVEAYEARRWPVTELDPVEAIEAAMAYDGHTTADLARLIGKSRVGDPEPQAGADAADDPQHRARVARARTAARPRIRACASAAANGCLITNLP